MNRRQFALSWGRKLFFGLSWPLTLLLTLLYLRSFILPTNGAEWMYYLTSLIGQTGLLTSVVYFALFCPLILLLPSYYTSRTWSLLLMTALNLFVFLDAISFSSYHLHIYSYLFPFLVQNGPAKFLGSEAGVALLVIGIISFTVVLWFRGEMIWRKMQTRFSNSVSNWYLATIVVCLLISRFALHHKVSPGLQAMFTLNMESLKPIGQGKKKLHYPSAPLSCSGKQNPNVFVIAVDNWSSSQFTRAQMPKTFHLQDHAMKYLNHRPGAVSPDEGKFSFLYSLPGSYYISRGSVAPAVYSELRARKYDILSFDESDDAQTMQKFQDWLIKRSSEEIRPYFVSVSLKDGAVADEHIQELVLALQREGLVRGAHLLISGTSSPDMTTPFLWIMPSLDQAEVSHVTTAYDVMPTLMQRAWNCKNSFKAASTGDPLEQAGRDWYITSSLDNYNVIDLAQNGEIRVSNGKVEIVGTPRRELIFKALKTMTSFYRSR